jgi:single-strand DNA-binding protein
MMNQVNIIGNLTRDPEVRHSAGGTAMAKLGLAINRKYKDKSGNMVEDTTFVDVDTFGRTAEIAGQYLRKGRQVLIIGRLKLDQWDDKNTGQKRSRLGVVAESVQFIGGRGDGGDNAPRLSSSRQYSADPATSGPVEDDDVPF